MANTYRHYGDFAPYYDDWESSKHDDKGYVKVLFKPSVAVQARELNQVQTYLNNQIASFGGYFFKDGTPVSGAKISYTTKQKYAIAKITYRSDMDLDETMAAILSTCKVEKTDEMDISTYTLHGHQVNLSEETDTTNISTYTEDEYEEKTYDKEPIIQITGFKIPDDSTVATTDINNSQNVVVFFNLFGGEIKFEKGFIYRFSTQTCTIDFYEAGECTCASCTKGIIFVDGYFINVPMESVLINPIENDPENDTIILHDISNDNIEYNVGFWITRGIVTAYNDTSLTDPANGSYNFKAPGADRYKMIGNIFCGTTDDINILVDDENKKYGEENRVNFVAGIVLKNNTIIKDQNNVGTNADLMDELARRTYEESGSYTVKPWKVQLKDTVGNGGIIDEELYDVSIEPGLGYIYGYRVYTSTSRTITNSKPRTDILQKKNNSKYVDETMYTVTASLNDPTNYKNIDKLLSSHKCYLCDKSSPNIDEINLKKCPKIFITTIDEIIKDNNSKNLKIYISYVDDNAILSNAKSIISISDNNILSYVNLYLTNENESSWFNSIAPSIFETGYNYIAPDKSTFLLKYRSIISLKSSLVDSPIGNSIKVKFNPGLYQPAVSSTKDIVLLIDSNGKVYNNSSISIATEEEYNTTSIDFYINVNISNDEPITPNYFYIYYVGYYTSTAYDDITDTSVFKTKTLTIGTKTIEQPTKNEIDLDVYDAICILSVKENDNEIYYTGDDSIEIQPQKEITLYPNITDYAYKKSYIYINNINTNATYVITFAYYKHSTNKQGYFCALSYKANENIVIKNNITTDIYQQRLYNFFGINGIYKNTSSISNMATESDIYKIIPTYTSKSTGSVYNLADCIDFRPDYDDNNEISSPLPGTEISYDLSIYLPRIDSVWIDKNGNFGITKGIPSETPTQPAEEDGSMILYYLNNKPYCKTLNDISLTYVDNKRHTMKDITFLAGRLSNLEEVVSMSLLEQSAVNMQVLDDDGIQRYKCGIFTDTFNGFANCDYKHKEWNATIDSVEQSIRTEFDCKDWAFTPITTRDSSFTLKDTYENTLDNVMMWDRKIITIKPKVLNDIDDLRSNKEYGYPSVYSSVYAYNDNFTEVTNIQSLMFATWIGDLVLNPAIDTWVNDLGEIVSEINYIDTEKPPTTFRTWTTVTNGTSTESNTTTTGSGLTYKDLDKTYGKKWREVPKEERVTHLPGYWEPATTTTTVKSYDTITTTTTTETTSYNGSYISNDIETYMEEQDSFMRVRLVEYSLKGMKPNSKIQATIDGIPVKLVDKAESNVIASDINDSKLEKYTYTKTDNDGNASGYFVIPSKMSVGTKIVEFFDDEKLASCQADYTANGKTVWTNVNKQYIREWNPIITEVSETSVSKKLTGKTTVRTASEIFHNTDPIAESFYVEEECGIMLEGIDIYFASKDPSIGVELFIVECVNGYPSETMVPFSRVFVPSNKVNITTEKEINEEGKEVKKPIPTFFKFSTPLYLKPKTEYAFIIIAPSYNYTIYTTTLGKADLVTGIPLKEQPYIGSMFKSQNLRTWTAEQLSDISFKIYCYNFDVNKENKVYFACDDDVYFGIECNDTYDNYVSEKNNLYSSDIPVDIDNSFRCTTMNISANTFCPNLTNIEFGYQYINDVNGKQYIPYNNKYDIFMEESLPIYYNHSDNDASLKVEATMYTNNKYVSPQIDVEDFHGIFTKNKVYKKQTEDGKEEFYKKKGNDMFKAGTYISKNIVLKEPARGIKLVLDEIVPKNTIVEAFYSKSNTDNSKYIKHYNNIKYQSDINTTFNGNNNCNSLGIKNIYPEKINDYNLYNIWYLIWDKIHEKYKFIEPSVLDPNAPQNVVIPSCNLMYSTNNIIDSNSFNLYLYNLTNQDVLKDAVITEDTFTYKYNQNANTNYVILGVYAIPNDSYMYDIKKSKIIKTYKTYTNSTYENAEDKLLHTQYSNYYDNGSENGSTYYPGIICKLYDDTIVTPEGDGVNAGDLFIYNNKLYINYSSNLLKSTPAVTDSEYGWKEIFCLFLGTTAQIGNESEHWIPLTVNDFNYTTERATNFMEYTYTTVDATDNDSTFDEFKIKVDMYAIRPEEVPRFRNLRAVAVY